MKKYVVFFCEEHTLRNGIKNFFLQEFPFVDIKSPTTVSSAETILQYHGPAIRLVVVSANEDGLTLFTNVQNSVLKTPFFFLNRGHASELEVIAKAKKIGAFDILTAPIMPAKLRSRFFNFFV